MKLFSLLPLFAAISISASPTRAFAASACGWVQNPLSAAQASSQLAAFEGTYYEQGFQADKTSDGKDAYSRFEVVISRTGITLGRAIYTDLFSPPVSFVPDSTFDVATASFTAPLEAAGGKFLVEHDDSNSVIGVDCFTFGLKVEADQLYISSFSRTNYHPTGYDSFLGSRPLVKLK